MVATPVQVALGTLSIYAYLAMPAVSLGLVWAGWAYRATVPAGAWPLLLVVAAITALISPATYLFTGAATLLISAIGSAAAGAALRRRAERAERAARIARAAQARRARPAGGAAAAGGAGVRAGEPGGGAVDAVLRSVRRYGFLYLGGALLAHQFLVTLETPWVTAEVFELSAPTAVSTHDNHLDPGELRIQEDRVPVGYLLAADDQWLTVLNAQSRYVMHLPAGTVEKRYTCHQEGDQLGGHRPLLWALTDRDYNSPNIACGVVRQRLVAGRAGD